MKKKKKRILEWVSISYSRGPSQPKDESHLSVFPALSGRFLITAPLNLS